MLNIQSDVPLKRIVISRRSSLPVHEPPQSGGNNDFICIFAEKQGPKMSIDQGSPVPKPPRFFVLHLFQLSNFEEEEEEEVKASFSSCLENTLHLVQSCVL